MKIVTSHWLKPIPQRGFDWGAIDSDTYDGKGSPIGYGATEEAAIADLLDQLIDHLHAESDVRRVLDSATGTFLDDFSGRSAALIDVVKKTRSTSVGTVTEAGLESLSSDQGTVLVAIAVTTETFGIAEKQPRYWRMRMTMVRDEDSAKVAKLDFVS